MIDARLESNGLILFSDIPVNIQLVTLLFLSNVSKLSTGTNKIDSHFYW